MNFNRARAEFGERLTLRMAELGMRPEDVSSKLEESPGKKVDPRTVRRWMHGKYFPQIGKLIPVAAMMNRSLSWMVGEELPDYPVNAEPLIRLSPQLTRSNIDALCVMAKELITSEAEAAARRPLPRAAEDESEYRAGPPADEDAASQGTDTGS